MPADRTWTIDSLAHALPHSALRQTFLRQVNLAPLPELPDVLAKWERFVAQWRNEAAPKIDAVLAYLTEHGELPAEHQETPESAAAFSEWEAHMEALRQEHTAA